MNGVTNHTIHRHQNHNGWNRDNPPALTVAPGDIVEIETVDSSGGQLSPQSTVEDVQKLDFDKVNPVTGPIFVDGAKPGDTLCVKIESYRPAGWGWTANIPGFGLLAEDFADPALVLWDYEPSTMKPALYSHGGCVPLNPFCGTIGVAPSDPGPHSIVPPRRVGGNMDVRDLTAGSVLYLPIEVDGALLSVGDTHAAQGDGEVCGTAIESPMDLAISIDLLRGQDLPAPQFATLGSAARDFGVSGYNVTTGIGPDLMVAAKDSVRAMIDRLGREEDMDPIYAYLLCSVCADLRISEIVDRPNWVVSFYFPRAVLA